MVTFDNSGTSRASIRKQKLSNRNTLSGVHLQPLSKRMKALDKEQDHIAEGVCAYNNLVAEMSPEVAQAKHEAAQSQALIRRNV